VTGKQGFP